MPQGKAYVKKGGVSKDGKDSVIINYRNTDNVFLRPMLDEMRRVSVSQTCRLLFTSQPPRVIAGADSQKKHLISALDLNRNSFECC